MGFLFDLVKFAASELFANGSMPSFDIRTHARRLAALLFAIFFLAQVGAASFLALIALLTQQFDLNGRLDLTAGVASMLVVQGVLLGAVVFFFFSPRLWKASDRRPTELQSATAKLILAFLSEREKQEDNQSGSAPSEQRPPFKRKVTAAS